MNSPSLFSSLLTAAWQCYQCGDLARAEELGTRAQALEPAHPDAFILLATVAFQAGLLDMAISRMRQAIEADRSNADAHNNLGVFYSTSKRAAEAVDCFQQALVLRQDFAEAMSNLSYGLYQLGRFDEASAWAERALQLRPDYAEANNHLGLALLELGRAEEAAEQFQTAIRLQPGLLEAHRNLGAALEEQGQLTSAMACYQHVLQLNPRFAEAHSDLGETLKGVGRFDEAVSHLRQALAIQPDCAFAWWNLSQFAAQGVCRLSDQEINQIRLLVESNSPALLDRSLLHLALALVLDQRGAYDAAFLHCSQGNDLRKKWFQKAGRAFDPAAHRLSIDQLIAAFDSGLFQKGSPGASSSELPIFVVGMPRSGSTLVEQILSCHPLVAGAGELRDLSQLLQAVGRNGERFGGFPACIRNMEAADVQNLTKRYLARLTRSGGETAVRVIDKMPENYLYLGFIALAFPQARVIHCRRDPLDLCMSCWFQNFKEVNFACSLEDLGHYHRDYERLMAHWRRVLPQRMFEVRYEDLVARQEAVSRDMVAYCGLDWDERCLKFHKNPRPVQTHSAVQVRRPMYADSIGRWKRYAGHLEPLWKALGLAGGNALPTSEFPSREQGCEKTARIQGG